MLRFPDYTQTVLMVWTSWGGGEHYWGEWGRQEHDLEGFAGVGGIDPGEDMVYGESDRWQGDDRYR